MRAVLRAAGGKSSLRCALRQGFHGLLATLLCSAAQAAPCPGPPWALVQVAPQLWWAQAAAGDTEPANGGRVSNLLAARQGARLWLLGSGPGPQAGRVLACQLRQATGQAVTDVVAPWARPELVLGQAGLGGVRRWAHADVAAALRRQCPQCVPRLAQRLGQPAARLGPLRGPTHLLHGSQGRLGPWQWQRLQRGAQRPVTVWRLHGQPQAAAWGLLWGDGPPDGRDAQLPALQAATAALAEHSALQWLPEQGPWLAADAPAQQAAYWQQLRARAQAAVARGEALAPAPPRWPGLPEAWATHPRHALNWQHAWREAEDALLSAAPPTR
jgi:hypothetical protein